VVEAGPSLEDPDPVLEIGAEEDVLDQDLDLENVDQDQGKDQGPDQKGLALGKEGGDLKRGVEVDRVRDHAVKVDHVNLGLVRSTGKGSLTNTKKISLKTERRNTRVKIFRKVNLLRRSQRQVAEIVLTKT
jgi:hypothetical protein